MLALVAALNVVMLAIPIVTWMWLQRQPTRISERHAGHVVELRVGPRSVQLRVDGRVVAQKSSRDIFRVFRLAHTTDDGLVVSAGQEVDEAGELRTWFDVTPTRQRAALPAPAVPELGTVELLIDELGQAFGDDDLSEPLEAVRQDARRHATVLDRAARGELGGPDAEALVEAHRESLVGITAELRRLRERLVDPERDDEIRDALLRLTAAAEVRARHGGSSTRPALHTAGGTPRAD